MQASPVSSTGRPRLARFFVLLIAAWVLAGATFKLFWGTPALLPKLVRDLPLELGLTYRLAIGIELAVVAVALSKPRWGWALQVALLGVFDFVLTAQLAAGEKNCGCFGEKFSMPPALMMAIDTLLLVGLMLGRPWRSLPLGPSPTAPIAVAAIALVLPWLFDRQANGKPAEGQWLELDVESWVGKMIFETPLGNAPLNQYVDVNTLPLDGLWVFYRQTCEHCRDHLAHLAEKEHGERLVTLVQLEEPNDTLANRVVNAMPDGNFVQQAILPPSISA